MPTDKDIRRLHVVEGWKFEDIAKMLGHSKDSVRGRNSRASLGDRVQIARELAEKQPLYNEGVERQKAVLLRADQVWAKHQERIRKRGGLATAIFRSDLHIPFGDWPAIHLYLLLVEAIQPDYISAMNDFFDFTGYGRWKDERHPAARLWDDDINNALQVAAEIHAAERKAAPGHIKPQVQGNHDNWAYDYLRKVARTGYSEHNIAHLMETLEKQGVIQFTDGQDKKENVVQLSPGLKWVHGVSASKNITSVARAVQEATRGRGEEEGIYYYTVAGHTHRSGEVKINGVKHWNAGTLGTKNPHYLKHRPNWDTSIVVNRFDPNSRYTEGYIVEFRERGGHLVARWDGVDYDVPLE